MEKLKLLKNYQKSPTQNQYCLIYQSGSKYITIDVDAPIYILRSYQEVFSNAVIHLEYFQKVILNVPL